MRGHAEQATGGRAQGRAHVARGIGASFHQPGEAGNSHAQDVHGDVSLLFKPGEGAYMRNADKRSCTDCIPCGIFIAYWSFMVFLAHMAFTTGDLNALLFPRDMVSDAPRRPRRCTNERHCGA